MRFDFVSVCAVLVCVSDKPYEQLPGERGREKLPFGRKKCDRFPEDRTSICVFCKKTFVLLQ